MGVRLPYTPNTKIRNALRRLWMSCREANQASKNLNHCCALCGAKKSAAKGRVVKLDIHHLKPPNWQRMFDVIREELLQSPETLVPLCHGCHDAIHETDKERAAGIMCVDTSCKHWDGLAVGGCGGAYPNGRSMHELCKKYKPNTRITNET